MTRTRSLALLALFTLGAPAQALKLIIWDRELQTKLGYGETTGKGMTVQLVKDYSGPVVALFSREDEEKATGQYGSVQSRYDGFLKAGQLTLNTPNGSLTLARFLAALKLNLLLQPSGQSLLLPGLRAVPDKPADKTTDKTGKTQTPPNGSDAGTPGGR